MNDIFIILREIFKKGHTGGLLCFSSIPHNVYCANLLLSVKES